MPLNEPLRSVGDLKDSYSTSGKEIRKFAEIDLGSLEFEYSLLSNNRHSFKSKSGIPNIKVVPTNQKFNGLCSIYNVVPSSSTWKDKDISLYDNASTIIIINNNRT